MKTAAALPLLTALALLLPPGRGAALAGDGQPRQTEMTAPLAAACPAQRLLRHPERCGELGAGAELTALARQGVYPTAAPPTLKTDFSLGYVPFDYLKVGQDGTPLFESEQSAVSDSGPSGRLEPGFVYLSYYDTYDTSSGIVYRVQEGFVRGDNVARISSLPTFQGMAFFRMPVRPFGWINSGGTCSYPRPGGEQAGSVRCFTRYAPLQIYATEEAEGEDWYRIGLNEWVEANFVARVDPDPAPPEGVEGDRWISVNLKEQTIAAYVQGTLVYASMVSSGRYGFWTQPGTFQVWAKLERDDMTGGIPSEDGSSYYLLEDVPWVLYFDQARALHGTYWHNKFGATSSRGCVNLTPADAHWFYDFAEEGTWVHVWDPSGETPTDPAVYGSGGA